MDIRLITVKDDFELAFNLLNQEEYALSFYEYFLKHDQYSAFASLKLIGAFEENKCVGTISYKIVICPYLGRILEVHEMHHKNVKAYKVLLDFLDSIASDESCDSIKIRKNKVERLNFTIFDKVETYFKNLNF